MYCISKYYISKLKLYLKLCIEKHKILHFKRLGILKLKLIILKATQLQKLLYQILTE